MKKTIEEHKRHIELVEECSELLNGLVKKRKFTLKITDELVSSEEVAKKALLDLKKIKRRTKASLWWSMIALRWLPDSFWDRFREIVGSLL